MPKLWPGALMALLAVGCAWGCTGVASRNDAGALDDGGCELGSTTNCGACGDECSPPTPLCEQNGASFECVAECSGNTMTVCDGRCVSTETNPEFCGGCDNRCEFPDGIAECIDGTCVFGGCNAGAADCNADEADGCETPLNTESNCSGCADTCASEQRCIESQCMPCPATSPLVSGSASGSPLCAVSASGNTITFTKIVFEEDGPDTCTEPAGTITLGGVTASGSASAPRGPLCAVSASGNTLTFTALEFEDDGPDTCTLPAGEIALSGATVSGSASNNFGLCGASGSGTNLTIKGIENEPDGPDPCVAEGDVILAPVCADTL